MKLRILLLFLMGSVTSVLATDNPVRDYLTNRQNVYHRADDTYYADDQVFVLDLDLMGNGKIEELVSSSLDRDGKAGSVWTVFSKEGSDWKRVGQMTFRGSRFYLGKIDQLNGQYGIVSFFPAGGGEGSFVANVFNGSSVQETKIGAIDRDPSTEQITGTELMQRYFGGPGDTGHPPVTTISAQELSKTYKIKNDSKKFGDAMREKHEEAVGNH